MTTRSTKIAISQSAILAPDWNTVRDLPIPEAADAVRGILGSLDTAEKQVFAIRGMALIVIEERKLWEGQAPSMGQWIKMIAPNSWGECYAAMRTVKELLPDIPLDDMQEMKRCTLEEVKRLSSAVRRDSQVIESAKTLPLNEFLEKVEKDHPHQHVESRRPLRFSPGRSGVKLVEEAIAWALDHDIAGTRDEAIVKMAETAIHEWQLEDELENMPAEREVSRNG